MYALIPTLVVALMILVLLAPEAAQDLLRSRIPEHVRGDPHRFGMRLVPSVAIFVFGFAMFQGWDRLLQRVPSHLSDPLQSKLAFAGGAFLLALGLCGCLWPVQLMERAVPSLRGKIAKLDPNSARKVTLVGKVFGAMFLLGSVYIMRRGGG